jgi:hypothetical protein
MSFIVSEIVLLASRTRYGKRINVWSLRVFGAEVVRLSRRDLTKEALEIASRAAARDLKESAKLIHAFVVMEAKGMFETLAKQYPRLFKYLDKGALADMVRMVMERGEKSFESLRGILVEALARKLPSTEALRSSLDSIRKQANKVLKEKWGPVRIVSAVRDGNSRELGDLLMICEDPDGRVWVMAIIESKSFSNVADLSTHGEKKVGQHLWDWTRAKTSGLQIEGKFYPPKKIEMGPVPNAAWGGPAVVSEKTAAQRAKEMAGGHYTEFIGFAPQELSNDKLLNMAVQGVQLEFWPWPFDIAEFNAFQKELTRTVERALR